MEREEMVIDSKFNFNKDLRLIRTRIHNILNDHEKDLLCLINYINIENIFRIAIELKPVFNHLNKVSPTFTEAITRVASGLNKINLRDMQFFERKMIIVSIAALLDRTMKFERITNEGAYEKR